MHCRCLMCGGGLGVMAYDVVISNDLQVGGTAVIDVALGCWQVLPAVSGYGRLASHALGGMDEEERKKDELAASDALNAFEHSQA